jgi:hypothetical protein
MDLYLTKKKQSINRNRLRENSKRVRATEESIPHASGKISYDLKKKNCNIFQNKSRKYQFLSRFNSWIDGKHVRIVHIAAVGTRRGARSEDEREASGPVRRLIAPILKKYLLFKNNKPLKKVKNKPRSTMIKNDIPLRRSQVRPIKRR